ncbi:MAG: hypothetical protein WDM77_09250 [Steroidobacteraceae bacterium]
MSVTVFFHGWLNNGTEGEIAEVLLAHGAAIEGSENRESPLIAAASLGAQKVATVLVNAGAALERTSVFGERAFALGGMDGQLGNRGITAESRCAG